MDDFVDATQLVPIESGVWNCKIREDWALWGPSGGYLSALALRAMGEETKFARPISFACQFLSRAAFGEAHIHVITLRRGKQTEALRADIRQGGKIILTAQAWTGVAATPGMQHDYAKAPPLPQPDSLPPYAEVYPDEPVYPFIDRLGFRPLNPLPHDASAPISEPEVSGFFQLKPRARHADPFIDAARICLLIDTYAWLATYPAHPSAGPSPWIAPNLDFYYRFHRPTSNHDWLYLKTRADLAEGGLIAAEGEIRCPDGKLLARGASQLICYPRPN